MPTIKLTGAVRRVNGAFHPEGAVVNVPSDIAARLLDLGVAEKVKADKPVAEKAADEPVEEAEAAEKAEADKPVAEKAGD